MNRTKYKFISPPLDLEIWSLNNGFRWNKTKAAYIRRFTVWRLYETTSIYFEIRVHDDYTIELDVYENPFTFYGKFYCQMWGIENFRHIKYILRVIKKEFDYLGIIEDPELSTTPPELHHMRYFEKMEDEDES